MLRRVINCWCYYYYYYIRYFRSNCKYHGCQFSWICGSNWRRSAWSKDRRAPGTVLHLSNEPGELSQWQYHDNSTV